MRLRFAGLGDADAVAAIYGPIVAETAISFEAVPPDAAEMRKRIATVLPAKPWIVAEHDGRVAGYAYATAFRARAAYRFSAETTVYVAADARRLGTGRALYEALLELLRRQGYWRAFAGIALPNPGSIALHEALGFTAAGVFHAAGFKFGAWHDVGMWERKLSASDTPLHEPRALSDLTSADVVAAFGASPDGSNL